MKKLFSSENGYRQDIDGLRALAVLSVFLFHLQPDLLPGGYLGVDVFFVISGYLITGIILRENHLGTFSFTHFYSRRIKRIFPALFVVLILSSILATFLLTPDTFENFMKSSKYASLQLANIFFSREVGYFDEGFSGQPLLHTWSLGVEEQFYLFWPLLIFLCFRFLDTPRDPKTNALEHTVLRIADRSSHNCSANRPLDRKIAKVMVALSLGSYAICYLLTDTHFNLAFYMFYTRAWEFCLGALVALRILPVPSSRTGNTLTGVAGLALLCLSFLFIREESMGVSFLQAGAIVPCIGTALIMHTNWQTGLANRILAIKLPVLIGKISYSLYLYHWPVIIFWKLFDNSHEIGISASICIIGISFILATLSYLFIEQPARKTTFSEKRVLLFGVVVIAVFGASFKGLGEFPTSPWRIRQYANAQQKPLIQYPAECKVKTKNGVNYFNCKLTKEPDAPIIALAGDSHAPHYYHATVAWAKKNGYDVRFLATPGCPMLLGDVRIKSMINEVDENTCQRTMNVFAKTIVGDPKVTLILLAQRFDLFYNGIGFSNRKRQITFKDGEDKVVKDHTAYYNNQLAYTVDSIRDAGKDLIFLKQVPIYGNIKDCDWEPRLKKLFSMERNCAYNTTFIRKWQQPSIEFIDHFAATHGVAVVDPVPYFDEPFKNGVNMYLNTDHLNEYGHQYMVPHFATEMNRIMASKTEKMTAAR